MKKPIIAIIVVCLVIVAMLSLGGTMKRRATSLLNRFENAASRQMTSKAAGGAYDTTDHYLKPLEIQHPSETLLKAMAEIPPDDAVVFIAAGDDERSDLIHHTISHLSWPRLIGEVRCGARGAPTELMYLPPAREPVKWLMFYRVAPPPDLTPSAKMIGPHLILTPASELKEWKSYCSR
ncbi:MAG: hypothetical protein JMDDDDMK_02245 [Acidobacteria bacterium]|nr:hypothetical protein [Acidobacteriota bacterium]